MFGGFAIIYEDSAAAFWSEYCEEDVVYLLTDSSANQDGRRGKKTEKEFSEILGIMFLEKKQ